MKYIAYEIYIKNNTNQSVEEVDKDGNKGKLKSCICPYILLDCCKIYKNYSETIIQLYRK